MDKHIIKHKKSHCNNRYSLIRLFGTGRIYIRNLSNCETRDKIREECFSRVRFS